MRLPGGPIIGKDQIMKYGSGSKGDSGSKSGKTFAKPICKPSGMSKK